MRKAVLFLILILSTSGLFAKEKVLYEKKSKQGIIQLLEYDDLASKYCIMIYEKDIEEGFNYSAIYSNDYEKIKELLVYILHNNSAGLYTFILYALEMTRKDFVLEKKSVEIDSKNNRVVNTRMYYLK